MFKLCVLFVLLINSAYSQTNEEKNDHTGPTLPLVKEVHNKEESRMHMGIDLGINNAEGTRGATPELGFELGYQPLIPFGLTFEMSTSRFDSADDEFNRRTTLMLRGTYNFGGDTPVIRYSYFGIASGAVLLHDGAEMGIAPVAGFDVPLDIEHKISLGFIAKYLFVTSKDPDSLITSAALKYWF